MKLIEVIHGSGARQEMAVPDDWDGDPSEFSIPLEAIQQGNIRAEYEKHKAYLADTDWYVARKAETGKDVPADVLEARATARTFISDNRETVEFGLTPPETQGA